MRVNTPILSTAVRSALDAGYRTGASHCYRTRCHVIILKSENRSSIDVGSIVGMHANTVNSWVQRYNESGLEGLNTKPGQGRKSMICVATDETAIKAMVQEHRQRVSMAQAEWEAANNKTVSRATFRRFLKELADGISVSASQKKCKIKLNNGANRVCIFFIFRPILQN